MISKFFLNVLLAAPNVPDAGLRKIINQAFDEYLVPVLLVMFIISAGAGVASNYNKITDDNEGTSKEGWKGMVKVGVGVFVALAILMGIVSAFANFSISVTE